MVSREELYSLVWSIPMVKVAAKFSVSGSYMARVCSALNVPRPDRGYWAKLEAGKALDRPVLPEPLVGEPQFWSQGDGDQSSADARIVTVTSAPPKPRISPAAKGVHALIHNAKQHYERGYKVDEGQPLRPYKRQLVDVVASAAGLDKALALANELFNALEASGHRVRLATSMSHLYRPHIDEREEVLKPKHGEHLHRNSNLWQPANPTVVYIGAVPFGLAVMEMTEETVMRYLNGEYVRESEYKARKSSRALMGHTWTTTKAIACGRLRLIVYIPQRDVSWSLTFQETVRKTLAQDVKEIVKSIENSVEAVRNELAEAQKRAQVQRREWDEQRERWRHEEDQRKTAASRKESREQLTQVIQSWATTVSIEQFFKAVEERADALPAAQQALILERLQLARETIGTQDPLEFFKSWEAPRERYVPLSEKPRP
jgi:hypothetical protein